MGQPQGIAPTHTIPKSKMDDRATTRIAPTHTQSQNPKWMTGQPQRIAPTHTIPKSKIG